jgi:hypothetical protein
MSPQFERTFRCYAIRVLVVACWLLPIDAAFSAAPKNKLQSLVNETVAQVQLAYRQHPAEQKLRRAQLEATLAAWRSAERSEANNALLATWLHAAMQHSMPGSREPLPPTPTFLITQQVAAPAGPRVERTEPKTPTLAIEADAQTDPFRDDPETERE